MILSRVSRRYVCRTSCCLAAQISYCADTQRQSCDYYNDEVVLCCNVVTKTFTFSDLGGEECQNKRPFLITAPLCQRSFTFYKRNVFRPDHTSGTRITCKPVAVPTLKLSEEQRCRARTAGSSSLCEDLCQKISDLWSETQKPESPNSAVIHSASVHVHRRCQEGHDQTLL